MTSLCFSTMWVSSALAKSKVLAFSPSFLHEDNTNKRPIDFLNLPSNAAGYIVNIFLKFS